MKILLVSPRGFCAGVNMAIEALERAIVMFGTPLYVFHEIVHNRYVVDGFRRKGVPFKRQKRVAGKTHYNFMGMAVFAVAGLLAASTLPLRVSAYIMPLILAAMIGAGVMYVQNQNPAYAVIAAMIFATYVSITLAFVSLYVARTYKNGLQRPVAFLDKKRSVLQPTALAMSGIGTPSTRGVA